MQDVNITLTEFDIKPETIRVKAGEQVKFTVTNAGRIGHDFLIEGLNIGVHDMKAGEVKTFEYVFPEPKVYTTACHHLGHEALGMKGKLIVE
jgi:plastocyanin